MSFGWARTEILGGLTNGCFLLSLSLYIVLEAIPRFIRPPKIDAGWPFIAVAAAGVILNTVGTLVFAGGCLLVSILPVIILEFFFFFFLVI